MTSQRYPSHKGDTGLPGRDLAANNISDALTEYRVIAAMQEGNFVSNETGTGYSVDNIAPATPQSFSTVADYTNGVTVKLSWSEPVDDDFSYFSIYRNSELLMTTISNNYSDIDVTYGNSLTYYIQFLQLVYILNFLNLNIHYY